MRTKFDFYSDPAHGWVKVTMRELFDLGIAGKISGYSYMNGENVFLEEDSDLTTFFEAYEQKYHRKPQFVEHIGDKSSKIRNYSSYRMPVTPASFNNLFADEVM